MIRVRAAAAIAGLLLGPAACTPGIDALRARQDKTEGIVPGPAGHALSCVADGAERSG